MVKLLIPLYTNGTGNVSCVEMNNYILYVCNTYSIQGRTHILGSMQFQETSYFGCLISLPKANAVQIAVLTAAAR